MFSHKSKAQGTIEYLLIIGIVVVIALVVGLVMNQDISGVTGSTTKIINKIGVGDISVVELVADSDTNGLLILKNTSSDSITVTRIVVDGGDNNYSAKLFFGEKKGFKLSGISSCSDPVEQSYTIEVQYTTYTGLSKESNFGEMLFPCVSSLSYSNVAFGEIYSVTYNGNGSDGGSVPVDSSSYEYGDGVTALSKGTLTNSVNTEFLAWNTAANGSGTYHAAGSTFVMGTNDVILYAVWGPPA